MQLSLSSFLDLQKQQGVFFSSLFLLAIICFGLWLSSFPQFSEMALMRCASYEPKCFSFETLGEGPLFLRSAFYIPHIPDLAKEISISFVSQRPDKKQPKKGEIFLLHNNESRCFSSQERIYLFLENGILHLAKSSSPLWIEVAMEEKKEILVKGCLEADQKNHFSPLFFSFSLLTVEKKAGTPKECSEISCQKLLKAKWYGENLFGYFLPHMQVEGKKCYCLESDGFHYVSEGEWLTFQENHWQKVVPGKETEPFPLAIIGPVKEQQMEIEVWDLSGKKEKILLNKQANVSFKTNPEEWISSFCLRSSSLLSLHLEKQHLLLPKGGWAYRKASRWRRVKNPSFLPSFAEAFFFLEAIEEKNGQKWIKGHFFNGLGTIDIKMERAYLPKTRRKLGTFHSINGMQKEEEKK